jgi:two-component system chemotaxis sensor kinase CheA
MGAYDQLAAGYREEAAERVAELEAALLELEERPGDAALVDRAFRALHTIKGSGALFGFENIATFTHEVETAFDAVRAGRLTVTKQLVSLTLEAKDLIVGMLEDRVSPDDPDRARVLAAFRALSPAGAGGAPKGAAAAGAPEGESTWRIRFEPQPELFQDGTNPLGVLAEIASLGHGEITARTDAVPLLEALDPERCLLSWDAVVTTDRGAGAIHDAFLFVADRCAVLTVEPADGAAAAAAAPAQGEQRPREEDPRARVVEGEASSIRVAARKLDALVDLVGELVIAQARLGRVAAGREDPELQSVAEELERLSGELRENTLEIRMVPIGTTFGRFRRVTRDLAAALGKEIDFVTDGADTELDKTVIERLVDPLVHLVRNACDHGIEAKDARVAAGKPACGTVRLAARHVGANVLVEISDDGAGLDPVAIHRKAVEKGLVEPGASLSERETFDLVFLPGFSTAQRVSDVSGRGVGMDVVKRAVEELRGTVHLASRRGAGTTVAIELPLTLAIIEGLVVDVAGARYVLPLTAVEECVQLKAEDVAQERGRGRLAAVRGELVPYVRLREVFGEKGARPPVEQLAVVHAEGGRCGLVVDGVVGQLQAVVKSLGHLHRTAKSFSGATVLGDGGVALILDVAALARAAAA